MDRNEQNRKLAEWLGIKPRVEWLASRDGGESLAMDFDNQWDCDQWCKTHAPYVTVRKERYPDFFTDEAASAMLLEKMPPMLIAKCKMRVGEPIQWDVQIGSNHELNEDRKTAIALAALALIEKEKHD